MLAICVDCRKIIGCIDAQGNIVAQCVSCPIIKQCKAQTPLGYIVERRVKFVNFPNGCLDHEITPIGFKTKH